MEEKETLANFKYYTMSGLVIFTLITGCSDKPSTSIENANNYVNSPTTKTKTQTASRISVAQTHFIASHHNPIDANATLALNNQLHSLTITVDAIHLTPKKSYHVYLRTTSNARLKEQKLNDLQADNVGEASSMTVIQHIMTIPPQGWRIDIVTSGTPSNTIASGKIHILTLS